jgi:outer membrane receptor protein involved in Fe transport
MVRGSCVALAMLALLVAPGAAQAAAQSRFEGQLVQQSDGTPVAGASVSIVGETGSARTNDEGRFTWSPVPPTPFQLIVVLPGGQVARPVLIEQIQLTVTVIPIAGIADEAITVLGAAPSVETAPATATTVLSARQIAQRSPETLMQALETVPGISQVSEGHAAVPAVRGMARGRTLFLIDGGRVTAERRVGPSATFLDPSSVEGIDVARGPGSVAYGSDAIGGVISVRTRRAEPGTPLQARATAAFGVGVPDARGSFELAKGLARGGVLMQAHVRGAGNYDSPEGEVFNSGWEDRGFLVHLTHVVANGFLSAAWQSDFGRDVERPRNNSRAVRFFYPYEDSHRFTSNYELSDVAGFRQIALTAFLGAYRQRTDQDRVATATRGRSLERGDLSANDFHVKANAERLAGRARVEFGIDVNGRFGLEALDVIQEFDLTGALTRDVSSVSIDNARRADTGAYVQAEAAVTSSVRASAGARADRVTTSSTGGFFGDRSTTNTAPSGFGAITVGPVRGFSLSLQLARAFRDPSLSDRYFRGPTGRGFITGNPDLKPETSLQYDLAARYTRPAAQLAVYYYEYQLRDLIERYETDIDVFLFRNRGRARVRGFEVEATSQLGRGYSIELSAQIARGEAVDDDESLDDISPDSVSFLGRKEFSERVYVQSRLALYAKDHRPGPSEIAMPGATLLDVGSGWKVRPQLELRGQVRNLLDDTYYASPDPRWVLAPGRSASVTAVVQF